jgi:hypothetical protein
MTFFEAENPIPTSTRFVKVLMIIFCFRGIHKFRIWGCGGRREEEQRRRRAEEQKGRREERKKLRREEQKSRRAEEKNEE